MSGMQLSITGAPQPLVLHSSSSCTHPLSFRSVYDSVFYPFWSAHPPKHRLCSKPYKAPGHPTFCAAERSLVFRVSPLC